MAYRHGMDQLPFRTLSSPLTDEMLAPLPESCQWVQFSSLPTPGDLYRIAGLLERHPQAGLRAYSGYDGSIRDLRFLSDFPRLRRFQIDVYELQNLDGLERLPDESMSSGSARPVAGSVWTGWPGSGNCDRCTWPSTPEGSRSSPN